MDPSTWLLVDDQRDAELALKRRLLDSAPDQVLAAMPEADAAATELLTEVEDHLRQHHPDLHWSTPIGMPAIQAAALLAQEDFCLLTRTGGGWVMTAACVCFPSRWNLTEKAGHTVTEIHGPVPHYDTIAGPVDDALDRLSEDRPRWRTNWSLLEDPALFQQQRAAELSCPPQDLTFRVERQTLRRLPRTGAVVFTIRTYRRRLGDITAHQPTLARDLAATLRTVDAQSARYKGWDDHLDELIRWLEVQ